jgi:hypothetical protein
MNHGVTMSFLNGLKRANLISLRILGEPVTLNDRTITAAVDDLSVSTFARAGGVTADVESAMFVDEDEFYAAGGKKGSIITFSNGKISRVLRIGDFQGVLYLTLGPFKP